LDEIQVETFEDGQATLRYLRKYNYYNMGQKMKEKAHEASVHDRPISEQNTSHQAQQHRKG
jgi:hypothetical protein